MNHSFYSADRATYKRTMAVGVLCCIAFIAVSFYARQQPVSDHVLVKADKLVRTAGGQGPAN